MKYVKVEMLKNGSFNIECDGLKASDLICIGFLLQQKGHGIIQKGEDSTIDKAKNIYECYESNIGLLSAIVKESIDSYVEDGLEEKLICKAITVAVEQNKANWSYCKAILERCVKEGVKTLSHFMQKKEEYDRIKNTQAHKNGKDPNFANFEQREYSEEDLEQYYITAGRKKQVENNPVNILTEKFKTI